MSRYKLGKLQIKRLLEDKPVMDGFGRKYFASEELKETLKELDKHNLYDRYDVIMYDGGVDILEKL